MSSASSKCTREHHEALKKCDARWRALTLVGVQIVEANAAEDATRLELRNCACGSTLGRVL
jgi:hypothetical protein